MKGGIIGMLFCGLSIISCKKGDKVEVNQDTYPIPGNQFFPEGIAYEPRMGIFYTGSTTNGDIIQVNVESGETKTFASGAIQGRTFATGMKLDFRSRLWVCGGAEGKIQVLNVDGTVIKTWNVKQLFNAGFINDCITDNEYIYFTDSQVPKIYRIRLTDAQPGDVEEWLSLPASQVPYSLGTNANGIERTADGKYLLFVVSSSGKLYRVDKESKAITEVQLNTPINSGDGLLLDGKKLYVSRNATNKIFPIAMSNDYNTGRVGEGFGDNLLFNTTMVKAGNYLLVVNGQLNKKPSLTNPAPGMPSLPFSVSRVTIP